MSESKRRKLMSFHVSVPHAQYDSLHEYARDHEERVSHLLRGMIYREIKMLASRCAGGTCLHPEYCETREILEKEAECADSSDSR